MFYLTLKDEIEDNGTDQHSLVLSLKKNHIMTKNWTLEFFIKCDIIKNNEIQDDNIFGYDAVNTVAASMYCDFPMRIYIPKNSTNFLFEIEGKKITISKDKFNKEWNHISLVFASGYSICFYLNGELILGKNAEEIVNMDAIRLSFNEMWFHTLNKPSHKTDIAKVQIWTNVKRSGNFTPPDISDTTDDDLYTNFSMNIDSSNINNLYENDAGYDDREKITYINAIKDGHSASTCIKNLVTNTFTESHNFQPYSYIFGQEYDELNNPLDPENFKYKIYDKTYNLENYITIKLKETLSNANAISGFYFPGISAAKLIEGNLFKENYVVIDFFCKINNDKITSFTTSKYAPFDQLFSKYFWSVNSFVTDNTNNKFVHYMFEIYLKQSSTSDDKIEHSVEMYKNGKKVETGAGSYSTFINSISFAIMPQYTGTASDTDQISFSKLRIMESSFGNYKMNSSNIINSFHTSNYDNVYDIGQELFEEQTVHTNYLGSVLHKPDILMIYPDVSLMSELYANTADTRTRVKLEVNNYDGDKSDMSRCPEILYKTSFSNNVISCFKPEIDMNSKLIRLYPLGALFAYNPVTLAEDHQIMKSNNTTTTISIKANLEIRKTSIWAGSLWKSSFYTTVAIGPNIIAYNSSYKDSNINIKYLPGLQDHLWVDSSYSAEITSFNVSNISDFNNLPYFPYIFRLGKKLINTPHTVEFWIAPQIDYTGNLGQTEYTQKSIEYLDFFYLTTINYALKLRLYYTGKLTITLQNISSITSIKDDNDLNEIEIANIITNNVILNYDWHHISLVYDEFLTIYINGENVFTTTQWDGYIHRLGISTGFAYIGFFEHVISVFFTGIKVMQTANHHANFNTPEELDKV